MLVKEISKENGNRVVTARQQDTIAHAANIMAEEKVGVLIIMEDNGTLVGILSERDIVRALPEHGASLLEQPIHTLMTCDVVSCHPEDPVEGIMKLMTDGWFRHMPVLDDGGKVITVISISDVVKSRVEHLEQETTHMREFISGRGY